MELSLSGQPAIGYQAGDATLDLQEILISGPESIVKPWLLGHTQRIGFRSLRQAGGHLLVDATLRVRCRHLDGAGRRTRGEGLTCRAHGFKNIPAPMQGESQPRRLCGDRFVLVESGRLVAQDAPRPRRSLPVLAHDLDGINPCSIAPCTTADHTRGSACCRDLQIEILCPASDTVLGP